MMRSKLLFCFIVIFGLTERYFSGIHAANNVPRTLPRPRSPPNNRQQQQPLPPPAHNNNNKLNQKNPYDAEVLAARQVFLRRAVNRTDPNRLERANEVFENASGIYSAKQFNVHHLALNNTILMTVMGNSDSYNSHYIYFLRNFLCFTKTHHLKPVVVILHQNESYFWEVSEMVKRQGGLALAYPEALFWRTVSLKKTPVVHGRGRGEYNADFPHFLSYGALVMLVPVLEALQLGYNVIYMDVDVAMVQDPLPYLLRGNADLTFSVETRRCQDYYSISNPNYFEWNRTEPNSGVMHVRSTVTGTTSFRRWLELIVDANVMNDQFSFSRRLLHLQYDNSCHSSQYERAGDPRSPRKGNVSDSSSSSPSSSGGGSYCFVDEILFQNGMMGMVCPNKKVFRDEYSVQLFEHGVRLPGGGVSPVMFHVNYVKDKMKELYVRGLWLIGDDHNPDHCHAYDVEQTYFGRHNWTEEVRRVRDQRREMFELYVKNGSLVKSMSAASVYYLDVNLTRHEIPSKEVFESLFGDDWGRVHVLPTTVVLSLALGDPFFVPNLHAQADGGGA
eukprot:gene1597-1744_t